MRIIKYQTVYQITFLNYAFPINCYLVEENDGLTLIDTGMSFCGKGLLKVAYKLKRPIQRIVLTHPHSDHVGSLDFLKSKLKETKVYMSARDAKLLSGDLSLLPNEPQNAIKGSFSKVNTKPDILLNDGDLIGSLKNISMQGHTPGSIAFYDERSKILIAGDAFQTRGGIAIAGDRCPLFPFIAFATWDKELALNSAKRLSTLDIDILATGHGNILENASNSIEKAILRAENNIKGGN